MTGGAGLLDPDPDRILIAIQAHLDHALGLTRRLTFSPQRVARPAEVPGVAARDRLAQRLVIHVRDHQHVAGGGIGRDTGHEPGRVEFRLEGQPLFAVVGCCGCGHGSPRGNFGEVTGSVLAPGTGNAAAPPDCRGTCR